MPETQGPGINLETSEVFQTSDLPEADQHYFGGEETTDSVETIHISTNEAFGKFKGTFVDNESVDFSDKIRTSRRKGYIVWKGEEESEEETPVKKYQRINCEIRELIDEIKEARSTSDHSLEKSTLENLSGQVDILHKHLLEMRLEDVLRKDTLDTMTDPQAAMRERLMSELGQIKSMKVGDSSSDVNNTKNETGLSYNLLLKPETSKLQSQSGVTRLANRIGWLEKAVGENTEDISILSMETGSKTLTEAISVLSSKTTVLEPKNLDHIEGRLAALQQKLGQEDAEAETVDEEKNNVIRDLAAVNSKSEVLAAEVPDVIDRMEALSPLHSQAADLSQSMLELEAVQKQLVVQLSNNSSLLKEIEKRFQSNLANIEKNFDSLTARIEAVKQSKS